MLTFEQWVVRSYHDNIWFFRIVAIIVIGVVVIPPIHKLMGVTADGLMVCVGTFILMLCGGILHILFSE